MKVLIQRVDSQVCHFRPSDLWSIQWRQDYSSRMVWDTPPMTPNTVGFWSIKKALKRSNHQNVRWLMLLLLSSICECLIMVLGRRDRHERNWICPFFHFCHGQRWYHVSVWNCSKRNLNFVSWRLWRLKAVREECVCLCWPFRCISWKQFENPEQSACAGAILFQVLFEAIRCIVYE